MDIGDFCTKGRFIAVLFQEVEIEVEQLLSQLALQRLEATELLGL